MSVHGLSASARTVAASGEASSICFRGRPPREIVVDWPEGTLNTSRFHHSANNAQCQACGHAIQNPFNWVPILAYNGDKVAHSLWVGRDCAGKLFGCEVEGDAIYCGWGFSYEYPGYFCYGHPDLPYRVAFTPDWEGDEELPIQVSDDDGNFYEARRSVR